MGQAPAGETYNTMGRGHPLIAGAGDFGEVTPKATKFTTAPTKVSRAGDIILCIRATIGDRNWADGEYCLGRGVAGLAGRSGKLHQRFLWHWLGYAEPALKAKGRGATFLQVNKADIGSMEIPVPPLRDQRRIAAILDKADALRAKRRETIAKLDQLLQSMFLDLFGDSQTNSMNWPLLNLADAAFFQEGPGVLAMDFRDDGVPLVRMAGLKEGKVTLKGCNYVDPEMLARRWSHFSLSQGDILVLTSASFGNPSVVDVDTVGAIFYTGIIRFRSNRQDLLPDFLKRFLASPWFMRQAKILATGATIKHFGPTHLRRMEIPLPPVSVQQRFAKIAAKIEFEKREMQNSAEMHDALFASLQHRAFAGSL